mgnify:CR=1 FL=1
MMLINEDLRKLWLSYTNQNYFLLKNNTEFIFLYEKKEKCGHTHTPTVKVARLIHKSWWLVFYYHHPQPEIYI